MAEPERRASWLELFFDLCFVVAVGAVAHTLHDEPTTEGIALFATLFIPVWWSWMEYAWYATSFPEGGAVNRFGAFAAMLTMLAMATQAGPASHGDPRGFILTFIVFHAVVVALFLRTARLYPGRYAFSIRYAAGFALAAAIWLVSLALPEEIRPWVGGRRPLHRPRRGGQAWDGSRVHCHLACRRGVVAAGSRRPDGRRGRRCGRGHWACLVVYRNSRNLKRGQRC